ncbi:GTSE1 protein, partial [Corythaixoides concolor]|nr:GTSE1 protein [Corythaixoides concolor]
SGNEDEVFVGPLRHKEKCIAVNIEAKNAEKKSVPASDDKHMWSPLTGEKFVEIFKEAHLLALQIETGSRNEQTKISQSEEQENKIIEKFVQDSKAKLKILRKQNTEKSPRAVKRETYCVQDSPVCQLPPCFQKESDKLLSDDKTRALHTPPNRSPVKIRASPTKSASSPLTQEQKKERNMKAAGKLPMMKPSSTLGKSNLSTIEKPKPGKHSSISTKRDSNSMGSSEDLISDKSSAASDVFESSFGGSFSAQDKKALPVPSQPGLKKVTHLKLPGVASGLTRKTTSSSSSVSSMNSSLNSSLLISPIGKNGKSSASAKATVSGSKLSSGTNRLALVRPTRVSFLQAANAEKSRKQATSASTPKISSAVGLAKSSASATSSEAVGSEIQRLSSDPSLQKPRQRTKDGSATKGSLCPKPKSRALSVPTSQTKVPVKTGDTLSTIPAPKATPSLGLAFCGTFGSAMAVSTPVRASEDGIFQNSFPERSVSMTPASLKQSGIPTPVRRISGFPAVTPKTAPRMAFSPYVAPVRRSSSFSTKKTLTAGSKQTKESKPQISSSEDDISPPPVLPLVLNFSPEKNDTEVVENELKEAEVQNQLAEEKQTEALLVDIGVDESLPHPLECESRPLIDLSNTPEVNKITFLKPTFSGQVKLIDLSSPLITLSPDVNKENLDSPLLKF